MLTSLGHDEVIALGLFPLVRPQLCMTVRLIPAIAPAAGDAAGRGRRCDLGVTHRVPAASELMG
jgi:hypothetical protein